MTFPSRVRAVYHGGMVRRIALPAALAALALTGCSGGGASAPAPGGGGPTTQTEGHVSSQVVLTQDPVYIRGDNAAVYGLVGTISDCTYNKLDPGIKDTQLFLNTVGRVQAVDFADSYEVTFPTLPIYNYAPNCDLTTDKYGLVYFRNNTGGMSRLNPATRTTLVSRTGTPYGGGVNPSGNKFVYMRQDGPDYKFYTSNLDGTGEAFVFNASSAYSLVRFRGDDGFYFDSGSAFVFYSLPVFFGLGSGVANLGTASMDGSLSVVSSPDPGLGRDTVRVHQGLNLDNYAVDFGATPDALTMSPDGQYLAAMIGRTIRVYNTRTGLTSSWRQGEFAEYMWWGYLPRALKLVGTGSNYYASAAGVALGLVDGSPYSFALWDAQTRTTSRLREDSGNVTGGNLVLTAEADRITSFKYSNDRRGFASPVSVGATVNTVVMVFQNGSGKLISVIPASVTRAGDKPVIERRGDEVVVRANAEAVYDMRGNNIAPGGASVVTVKGGKVTAR